MSIVNDPVEDGVGQGWLADQVMPSVDGYLADDQGGAATFSLCGAFVAHGASGAGLMTDGGVRIREDEPKPRMAAALHRTP